MAAPQTIPKGPDRGQNDRKRQFQGGRAPKRQRTRKEKPIQEGSHEEVLLADVRALFATQKLDTAEPGSTSDLEALVKPAESEIRSPEQGDAVNGAKEGQLPEPFTEIEVRVVELSSTGDGLALHSSSNQIYVVPFTAPGDIVKVKVVKHLEKEHYSLADLVSVVEASPLRDDTRVNCKYFSKCSGCQFQMLDYETQLKHKKTIVEKAYKNFSQLPPELVPVIEDTIGSPLQYAYRTKLTPHFDGPPGFVSKADRQRGVKKYFQEVPRHWVHAERPKDYIGHRGLSYWHRCSQNGHETRKIASCEGTREISQGRHNTIARKHEKSTK